jgi:hypothetical protein
MAGRSTTGRTTNARMGPETASLTSRIPSAIMTGMKQSRTRERSPLSAAVLANGVGFLICLAPVGWLIGEVIAHHAYGYRPHDPLFLLYWLLHNNLTGEVYKSQLFIALQNQLSLWELVFTAIVTFAIGATFGRLASPRLKRFGFIAWAIPTMLTPWALSQVFILMVEQFRNGHVDWTRFDSHFLLIEGIGCALWVSVGLIGAGLGRAFNRPSSNRPAPKAPAPRRRRAAAADR